VNVPARQPSPVISDADFVAFRDYFYRRTGIRFADNKRYFVDKRLISRIEATGHTSFRAWFTAMRFQSSGEELSALINVMTVNETYFFRERYQFDALVRRILPELVEGRRRSDALRILCLPCSTGEEPYSIAITLSEAWDGLDDWDVEIVGADIDRSVLGRAREGRYRPGVLRHVSAEQQARWFRPLSDGRREIDADLRDSITFEHANLVDPASMARLGVFDVVFCRNVLIYFDDITRRTAVENLFEHVRPGGFIFLGHSESMSRISSLFVPRRFPEAVAYQHPLPSRSIR